MSVAPSGLPLRARVVIVGGGVIGTSVAYHLAALGWSDVLVIERARLTSGTTWHAAGLMTCFGSLSETSMSMRQYTRELYARLESETGVSTGFNPVGFIEVAADEGRLEEFRRVAAFNRHVGLDVHEIGPKEIADRFPLADTSDLLAGFFVPADGRVNPVDVTMSLAKGARMRGVTIVEGVSVHDVLTRRGAVAGVSTSDGDVECEYVVNCAGMWARQLGERHGVTVPLQAAEHYYLITEPIEGVDPAWPVLEDPSRHGYYREEGGGLMVGLFEPVCAPWRVDAIPEDFTFGELEPDWDRMGPYVERAMSRVPVCLDAGIRTFFCGPESFTPDLSPLVGQAPDLDNYFVAAGMNSVGILTGGGIGRILAQWIVDGKPDVDVTAINIDRAQDYQLNPRYRAERTAETLGMVYQTHFPGRSMQSARGVKRSPIHTQLAEHRAYFKDVSGWESPDWFAPPGVEPIVHDLTWGRQNWFDYWADEHRAVRERVGFMDMSFMSKFSVHGPSAGRLLNLVCANDVDTASGLITYTQILNAGGTIEADVTVTKLGDESFMVVASDTAHGHVRAWLRRHLQDEPAVLTDVTPSLAQFNVQGPLSRTLLQSVTSVDMTDTAFGFRAARYIDLGFARALCVRITYLGELGYELYVPADQATYTYELLVASGEKVGLAHVGLKALSSLRIEKAYRDYGHDIDNTDNTVEAGLSFAVAIDKPGGFIGREAVLAQRAVSPPARRLLQVLVLDPEPLMHHGEIVLRDSVPVGYVRAASYGHTLGGAVGLAMVHADAPLTADWIDAGAWEVDIAGQRHPARVSLRPIYDPDSSRIRA